jgi:hypothetical protein
VDGLKPGDTVALTGFDKLQDGTKVEVEKAEPATGEGPAAGTLSGKSGTGQAH